MRGFVIFGAAIFFGGLCMGGEADWTRFRGPNGAGIVSSPVLPLQWTEKDYRWRVELPGTGSSSPVAMGDRVFVTCTDEKEGSRVVLGLSAADGKKLWSRTLLSKTHAKNKQNSYASPTPALDAESVFVSAVTPENYVVVALSQADGSERWHADLGPYTAQHGFGASPIVVDGLVIVTSDQEGEEAKSRIVALDAKTGAIRWETPRNTKIATYSTPCLFTPDGGKPQLILTSTAHGIYSLDPTTGRPNWELPVITPRLVGSAIVCGQRIITSSGTGGGGKKMFAVQPGIPEKKVEAKVDYEFTGTLPYVPTPVTNGKLIFWVTDSGVACCVNPADGEYYWKERIGTKFYASPLWIGDRIYCISRDGEVTVLAASEKHQVLATFSLGEPTDATPAVAGGSMYVRTQSHLIAIGGKK